jgi:hypothetical protein
MTQAKKSIIGAVCIALVSALVAGLFGCSSQDFIDLYKPAGTIGGPYGPKPTGNPDMPPATEQPADNPGSFIPLAEYSWADIDTVSQAGLAADTFNIGDEKQITLSTDETLTFVILGFDHDFLAFESKNAGITFGMKNLMRDGGYMNDGDTNVDGWVNSNFRNDDLVNIFVSLPDDLKAAIKPVVKISSVGGSDPFLGVTIDSLFLLSEVELFGSAFNSLLGEGTQYEYYRGKPVSGYIKRLWNGEEMAANYWLRSAWSFNAASFCLAGFDGIPSHMDSGALIGVSFAFCV